VSQTGDCGKEPVVGGLREPSDELLIERVVVGDGEAFGVFYRRHLPVVVAYLRKRVADREVVADLAAEVFAAALVSAPSFRPEKGVATAWLLGISRNKMLESLRRGRVESAARRRLNLEPIQFEDADLQRVEELATSARALDALDHLPKDQRDAVLGRVVEEQDYAELAARLDCSEMVVRQRVSRGLRHLKNELEEPA